MEILTTADGSHTLRHELLGELYHSDRGAIGEALHVFINAGLNHVLKIGEPTESDGLREISILEVGFGSGLNAWLTLNAARDLGVSVNYHAIELYPISIETAAMLNFTTNESFLRMHTSEWNKTESISDYFTLTKHNVDLLKFDITPFREYFDLVYFDAFAPDSQPDLWSSEVFQNIWQSMCFNGILTTYTAKGTVKEALRSAGFTIERLEGALGKRHMLRATKKLE